MINLPFKVLKILRVKYSKRNVKTAMLTNVTYYLFEFQKHPFSHFLA